MTETEPHALHLPDAEATRRLGRLLGESAETGDVFLLQGDLGAGKTTLTQGLAQGLGIADRITSPTFALLHEYDGRLLLYHFDLYRLDAPDLSQLGFEEIWEDGHGVVVIEWPERLGGQGPTEHLEVRIVIRDDGRVATLAATGDRPHRLLQALLRAW